MNDSLQQLLDRQAIHDVLMRYARGIDRLDMALVRSCYHPEARDDHGSFKGPVEEFIPWVQEALARFESTMHFLGNELIDVDGDRARAETYCIATHRRRGEDVDWVVGVRYVDLFERRDGEWRIADRAVVFEWSRVDEVHAPSFPPEFLGARRDRSDPVYRR